MSAIAVSPASMADSALHDAMYRHLLAEAAVAKARQALVSAELDLKLAVARVGEARATADHAFAAQYAGCRYYFTGINRAGGGWGGPAWRQDVQTIPAQLRNLRANAAYESVSLITESRTASGRWGARRVETFTCEP